MKSLLTLIVTALAIGFAPAAVAIDVGETNLYLIETSGRGPADLEAAVNSAGGTLKHQMPDLSLASAYSEDPLSWRRGRRFR